MTPVPWWREAVIYQVYVRSFADGDGDGLGDLPGVIARLPYLRRLGIDAVWLNPFYPSPQADAGYDVADYRDVDPRFGTLDDADRLIAEAHANGIRVIFDIVPNHTSDEHAWFRAAVAAGPGSPERARYVFRDGQGPGGDEPPNDWESIFGGPAWTRVAEADGRPGQWYLHLFDRQAARPRLDQPRGPRRVPVDPPVLVRPRCRRLPDRRRPRAGQGTGAARPRRALRRRTDRPKSSIPTGTSTRCTTCTASWRRVSDTYDGERAFVGEVWVSTPERLARYLRPDELHTAFNFDFLLASWDADGLRSAIDQTLDALAEVGAPPTWVLSNHDVIRHVTRYGGGELGRRRARAAALLMLALPGGAYVYQGEELGLEEILDLPDELRQDPTFLRTGGAQKGRDGCRVPLPWSGAEPPFGFGPGSTTWLPQPAGVGRR